MKILITGSGGMVGSTLIPKINGDIYTPSSSEVDLTNDSQVADYFHENKFDYVVHLAAYVGSLHDNIENRVAYFDNNILMNTLVTKYAYSSGVKNFLGVLSTCIYPDNCNTFPIPESNLHNGAPHKDLMSYAYAKRSHAVQLDAYKETFGVNYNYLIPCNIYGIGNPKHKDRSHYINDLIFKIIDAQKKSKNVIELFGDGTPLRQFMLADDFSLIISRYIELGIQESFNVAPNWNLSIEEIAKVALKTCGSDGMGIVYNSSKPNGQHRKDVNTSIMNTLMDTPSFTDLEIGIKRIYDHYLKEWS